MRFLCFYFFLLFVSLLYVSPFPSSIDKHNLSNGPAENLIERNINIDFLKIYGNLFKVLLLSLILITILWLSFMKTCLQVKYVCFNINLNLCKRKNRIANQKSDWIDLFQLILWLFFVY